MFNQQDLYSVPVTSIASRSNVLGKVLALLGFSFVFTAGGAVVGTALGPSALLVAIIGSLASLIILNVARNVSPLNLGLLYLFATFEGMFLGLVLEAYLAQG